MKQHKLKVKRLVAQTQDRKKIELRKIAQPPLQKTNRNKMVHALMKCRQAVYFKVVAVVVFNVLVFCYRYFWKSAPDHSTCDASCRENMLCRLMTGRSHDNSACTLVQETFSEEKRQQFEQSLDVC